MLELGSCLDGHRERRRIAKTTEFSGKPAPRLEMFSHCLDHRFNNCGAMQNSNCKYRIELAQDGEVMHAGFDHFQPPLSGCRNHRCGAI
jgi:hypothetical protein